MGPDKAQVWVALLAAKSANRRGRDTSVHDLEESALWGDNGVPRLTGCMQFRREQHVTLGVFTELSPLDHPRDQR
jgi:hypothetical protein